MIRPLLLLLSIATASAGDAISLYTYSEYIDPTVVEDFTAKTGTMVKIDTYEAQEEMLAKLQTGGAGSYDVIVASDVVVKSLIGQHLVRALDQARIPNRKNIWDRFADQGFDPKNVHSVPYLWGTVGLAWRSDKLPKGVDSWGAVLDPAQIPGPFVFMDEQRSQLGGVLQWLGKSSNSRNADDLTAAGAALVAAKAHPRCLGFDGGVGGLAKVVKGEALVAVVYNGDAVRTARETPEIRYAVPKEGSALTLDNLLISAKAPNPDQAHAFIDFLLDAEMGARNANFLHYATPNAAALPKIDSVDRANPAIYPPDAVMQRLVVLEDLGAVNQLYEEVWTGVKAK